MVTVPLAEAEANERVPRTTHDQWTWLLCEVRQALEPITPNGELISESQASATIETAAKLMNDLPDNKVKQFAKKLLREVEALVAPIRWVGQQLEPWRKSLDSTIETAIFWAWQSRDRLGEAVEEGFSLALQPAVRAIWDILSRFHRSSSIAECIHSWLRPYLAVHRGMPDGLMALLQLYFHHHSFARGKRAGNSPLELAGVEEVPTLKEVLSQLFDTELVNQAA